MTTDIDIVNYVRPNGRRENVQLPLREDLGDKIQRIVNQGLVFESEYLSTGDWSITISDRDSDLAHEIVFRSQLGETEYDARSAVIARFEKMIEEFQP